MQVNIQMVTTDGDRKTVHDILGLERKELSIETLGLTLHESKTMTAAIQKTMIDAQVEGYVSEHKACPHCGKLRPIKGYHAMICRTLFGRVSLKSPRLLECSCQGQKATTVSPLPKALVSRAVPELLYLESKWASLIPYGAASDVLEEFLPIKVTPAAICNTAMQIATRLEQELPEEQHMYVEGCQRTWDELPRPGLPITVALDGGYCCNPEISRHIKHSRPCLSKSI